MRIALLTALVTPYLAAVAGAQVEDFGFAGITQYPDVDLAIGREKAYGAGGVDLSAFGLPASADYVQSIYVRARHGNSLRNEVVRGRLVFPPQVTTLGIISDEDGLGGSIDDGILTESDALFAIDTADKYSSTRRGLTATEADHACARSNNTVDFHFKLHGDDLDDFRVILDDGSSFPPDLAFDVELLTHPGVQAIEGHPGIVVGLTVGLPVGAGDWGEVQGLSGIALTSGQQATPNSGLEWDMTEGILIHRNGGLPNGSRVDLYNPTEPFLGTGLRRAGWRNLSRGPYGYVYSVELNQEGYVFFDLVSGGHGRVQLPGIGAPFLVTGEEGSKETYLARHASSDSSPVQVTRVNVDTGDIVASYATTAGDLVTRTSGIAVQGKPYLLGVNNLITMEPATGAYTLTPLATPNGSHRAMECDAAGTKIYLLRSIVAGGGTAIDEFDIASGTITYSVVQTPILALPSGITRDSAGLLWIVENGWAANSISSMVWDPAGWNLVSTVRDCGSNNASGEIRSDVQPSGLRTRSCAPAMDNTSGYPGWVAAFGSLAVADNDLRLGAFDLPAGQTAYFLNSASLGFTPNPGGSTGNLCLGVGIGRHNQQVMNSGTARSVRIPVDLGSLPRPGGLLAVQPGETWHFQCWYRDQAGASNFTDVLSLLFH